MRLASLFRNLTARRRVEQDLDDELGAYMDQLVERKRTTGMSLADAKREAALECGGLEQLKEDVREVRSGHMFDELLRDLQYGMRTLRRTPSFTLAAILALALGIGANTAMFSVAYGILFRPLPGTATDRVAVVYLNYSPRDFVYGTMCMRDYLTWKENNHVFEEPALFEGRRFDVGGNEGVPEQVQGAQVTAGYFTTLGANPLIGRTFAAGEDAPGTASRSVISEAIWRRRFASNPDVVGRTILLNGETSTVIGVMPDNFRYLSRNQEIWSNLRLNPPTRYGPWFYRGIARLKPGVTLEQAKTEMNSVAQRLMTGNPYYKRAAMPVLGLRDALLGTTLKPAILILAGAVGLVLLIAVVNVANLMLARSAAREKEMALRLSLGAGHGRLLRQLLTESVLLAGLGGAAGLVVAWGSIQMIRIWNPGNLPLIDAVRLDGTALAFMIVVSMLAGVLFGIAPALQSARADLNSTLKEGGRSGTASHARTRTRAVLVVAEIALSLMLLIGAGLLLRSFANLQQVSAGFAAPPNRLLTMLISPGNRKYKDAPAGLAYYDEALRRAQSVPGVESAAVSDSLPPDQQGDADSFEMEGQTLAPGELNPIISDLTVGPDFFATFKIPLIKGRYFTSHDTKDAAPAAIVSQGFVDRFYPHQDPIGKRIRQSGSPWMQIVGVVGNVKYLGLTVDTDPAYYMAFAQNYGSRMFLIVRSSSGNAAQLADQLRRDVQAVDAGATLAQIRTMEQSMDRSFSQPRFDTLLLGLFAGIALVLAAVGIYGLVAYSVAQRTNEIGVRMALGASAADVLRMVVGQGATLAAIGIAAGLAGAFALSHLLKSLLFGVGTTDVATFAAAPLGILLVVLLATLLPALRAMRISPVTALRYE